ncbi:hypothetical protein STENM36S_09395 [Streptomyces tendae]
MSSNLIRVGIIGADTKASWAGASHIPALAAQPDFHLAGVATRHEESARGAAEAFGAERWFADPYALIGDPSIDLVTVAVKVPAHRELVLGDAVSSLLINDLAQLYRAGRFPIDRLLSFYDFADINTAFEDAGSGRVTKAVLRFTSPG